MYTGRCCSGYAHLSEHEWIVTERCPPQGSLSAQLCPTHTLYLHSVKISLLFNHAFAGRFHTLKLRQHEVNNKYDIAWRAQYAVNAKIRAEQENIFQAFSAVRGSIHFDYFIILVRPQPFSLASCFEKYYWALCSTSLDHTSCLLNFLPLVDLPTNLFTYWLYSATKVQARTHLRNVNFWGHAQLTNELCAGRMQTC